ncbi:MAG: hypothetical protein HC866_16875 [Leptolyngbyaceae cyanobacterium RU_5_1]|nr:hypothetical protein [Leptolyngbyaceae cyanobacterium RU_5_1]
MPAKPDSTKIPLSWLLDTGIGIMEDEDLKQEKFDREYIALLTDRDRMRVRIKTRPNYRPTYVFQLECRFGDKDDWIAVIRADDFHDRPHLDVLSPDGDSRKEWIQDWGDDKRNMKEAQQLIKSRWERERQRYESELERR